ncbi:MFS general substrate transporter [Gymnopus androsaceus JB14]|uniref:MFS general substrate transporter n=1 Tax=Gymnopus androsaceus JB14 TaxID=1447944 RepID=A0A6A4I0Z5_9AGAR|nr:MFS general substrate transporter [Gymnopus androsaceus JB14]
MAQVDEETPLLQEQQSKPRTPLPWFQFSIILFLQLPEPLTSQVIYPFLPQLIRDIGVAGGDETKVGHYAGLLQSLFFLSEAVTILHWSRISDRVGRKPVILIGLFGLSITMYCFGLSMTFWGLVLSRSLSGALNGNIGVIKSMMVEMTDATNISQAYAYMPIAWSNWQCTRSTLANPAKQFPHLFGDNEFLRKYPYFLPCAVPATLSAIAWLVTIMFLKETVKPPPFLFRVCSAQRNQAFPLHPILTALRMKLMITKSLSRFDSFLTAAYWSRLATTQLLSLVDITFRAIQPLFFSTPIELGGLGLEPSAIGNILSIFFFAKIHDYLGSKKTFIMANAATLPIFVCFPILTYLVKINGTVPPLAWVIVGVQIIFSLAFSFGYGAIFIYISAASPNTASLGATYGFSQMTVSVCRALGPAASNSLFSLSLRHQYLGGFMVYYVLLGIAGLSLLAATMLPRKVWA